MVLKALMSGVIPFQVGCHRLPIVAGKGSNRRNEMAKIVKMIRSARLQGQHRSNFVVTVVLVLAREILQPPKHSVYFSILRLRIHVFPQIAKLLGFLLQV